ncbi:hypothetical protein BD413DRAFT_553306 [Trametes elegans]|nr:hypothetical protein BD413DRAFT_553306 [Trametes elegans]
MLRGKSVSLKARGGAIREDLFGRLPNEMVVAIFENVYEDNQRSWKTAIELSHVCRRWRQLAQGTSYLWSTFNIKCEEQLDHFFWCSRLRPVDITFSSPGVTEKLSDYTLDLLHFSAPQWRSFTWEDLKYREFGNTRELLPTSGTFPQLKAMSLKLEAISNSSAIRCCTLTRYPVLETLTLKGVDLAAMPSGLMPRLQAVDLHVKGRISARRWPGRRPGVPIVSEAPSSRPDVSSSVSHFETAICSSTRESHAIRVDLAPIRGLLALIRMHIHAKRTASHAPSRRRQPWVLVLLRRSRHKHVRSITHSCICAFLASGFSSCAPRDRRPLLLYLLSGPPSTCPTSRSYSSPNNYTTSPGSVSADSPYTSGSSRVFSAPYPTSGLSPMMAIRLDAHLETSDARLSDSPTEGAHSDVLQEKTGTDGGRSSVRKPVRIDRVSFDHCAPVLDEELDGISAFVPLVEFDIKA